MINEKFLDAFRKQYKAQHYDPATIADAIKDHSSKRKKMQDNYGRYKQEKTATPILTREIAEGGTEINNKLANDWMGEIVDTKQGYLFGYPMTMNLERGAKAYEQVQDELERFRKRSNLDDVNSELGKMAAITGYDGMIMYIDKDGNERVKRVNGADIIFISEESMMEPEFAIHYYERYDGSYSITVYDDSGIYIYEADSLSGAAIIFVEKKPHPFDYCPAFGVPNNDELLGDADKVLSLIDGYDNTVSDMNSEIEQHRLAYMIFLGYAPDAKQLADMRELGALYLPDVDEGQDIKYLVKQLDATFPNSHLDRLEANISRFAKHVDFTDEAFGGNLSGVAMRYKLFGLETKAKVMERKHDAAMSYMMRVLSSSWAKKGIPLDPLQVTRKYTRNIPVNILDEVQAAVASSSLTSRRTALELLSYITDVEAELERIEEERQERVDLDNEKLLNDTGGKQQEEQIDGQEGAGTSPGAAAAAAGGE